ncbi:NADP-dependent malic enzyme [Insolitispirillum peregrinum]|uniref:Malate dehydrogenase (Oxaloacetate-decarboxylating)(NADP+) n=1 Tax=Insolitispirillum peregrinum TaxID=80876 RepID=A0A1N7PM45_9PROT|nr:NADP-dependent malic enzyme [Insolitispirillum peregrinum]SIT11713.1 malate dehydrogenase (oxaloacetate-decarboxylating)(NADP+) [Insolitispirillum peregrinum]
MLDDSLKEAALFYHRFPSPGKLATVPTKQLTTQHDLALAYSPGVAAACDAIVANPAEAAELTMRANLVAVVTNGTAVLGLGNIGPLASKPVMEGKAVLFKKFAGIDAFDLEIAELDPDKFVDTVARLEPTFGAINLEDIKAPECFIIERKLRERMQIPVFHDDQHGTAIVAAAAVRNGLRVAGKKLDEVRMVSSGGGAAGIACLDLLVELGLKKENIILCDVHGVVYEGRPEGYDENKARYAVPTNARTLGDVIEGADIFLGLSAGGVLKPEMVAKMGERPLILALANPNPEISPEDARAVRPDAIICTGRSDYPNQVNNVLCFPFIFRGALDTGATEVTHAMKVACVEALERLTHVEAMEVVASTYADEPLRFGPNYLLPKPFDPRLILEIAPAVAQAAMDSGVATRPITDFDAYRERLGQFVFRSGMVMRPVYEKARRDPKRVVFAEGEDDRVLRTAQVAVDEGIAKPILLGRRDRIEEKIAAMGLRFSLDRDVEVVEQMHDSRRHSFTSAYYDRMRRRGVTPQFAHTVVGTRATVFASLMLRYGFADAMICGLNGRYGKHLEHVMDCIGLRKNVPVAAAMNLLILPSGPVFICDTQINADPTAEQIVDITLQAAEEVRRFGLEPQVALLSASNFGGYQDPSSRKMAVAREILEQRAPHLIVEGEMHADAALDDAIRQRVFPDSRLKGAANLLVMPSRDAANIAMNMTKVLANGLSVGPMLLGMSKPVHICTTSITTRGLTNITTLAVVDAQLEEERLG